LQVTPHFHSLVPDGFAFKKGAAIRLKLDPADPQGSATFQCLAVGKKVVTAAKEAFAV
jgi:hypothetical protein